MLGRWMSRRMVVGYHRRGAGSKHGGMCKRKKVIRGANALPSSRYMYKTTTPFVLGTGTFDPAAFPPTQCQPLAILEETGLLAEPSQKKTTTLPRASSPSRERADQRDNNPPPATHPETASSHRRAQRYGAAPAVLGRSSLSVLWYTAWALTIWIHSDLVMLPGLLMRFWNTLIRLDRLMPSLAYGARASAIS